LCIEGFPSFEFAEFGFELVFEVGGAFPALVEDILEVLQDILFGELVDCVCLVEGVLS
jgi:hypothetical protein